MIILVTCFFHYYVHILLSSFQAFSLDSEGQVEAGDGKLGQNRDEAVERRMTFRGCGNLGVGDILPKDLQSRETRILSRQSKISEPLNLSVSNRLGIGVGQGVSSHVHGILVPCWQEAGITELHHEQGDEVSHTHSCARNVL